MSDKSNTAGPCNGQCANDEDKTYILGLRILERHTEPLVELAIARPAPGDAPRTRTKLSTSVTGTFPILWHPGRDVGKPCASTITVSDARSLRREELLSSGDSPPPAPVVTPRKRALPTPEPTPPRPHKRPRSTPDQHRVVFRPEKKSSDFYLPTGNVVIRAHTTLFKLDRGALARSCTHFDVLFRQSGGGDVFEVIDHCRVYDAPKELIVGDFTRLLTALKDPLSYFDNEPTQAIALSVLRAAHTLSCNVLHVLARTRLVAIWDSRVLPPPLPGTTADDDEGGSVHLEAIHMLSVAHEYSIPLARVEKRILYTLLSSRAFWATIAADRAQIALGATSSISSAKRGTRSSAHGETLRYGMSVCGTRATPGERNQRWRTFVTEEGVMEDAAVDPIRYGVLESKAGEALRKMWCEGCLQKWESGWMEKRKEWWGELDAWLKLA
ncbi:hypothetical protein C8Q80DRAFT_1117798 [Daedaleopsis nitida]|nr:hypothetical protein C8Q80DRAFT_1117798 [Daedaleopsis nitida]